MILLDIGQPTFPERGVQGGPIVTLAALHLFELSDQLTGTDEASDGVTLGVEPQAADPLTFGRHSIVGDEFRGHALIS